MLGAVAVCAIGAAPASAAFTPGAAGLGDPFFPRGGNGGYDVAHYDIDLNYTPATNHLVATTTIRATATQDLSALRPRLPRACGSPRSPSAASRPRSSVTVRSSWSPRRRASAPGRCSRRAGRLPRHTAVDHRSGWTHRGLGDARTTARSSSASRRGSPTWFPCNDHPTDKATYEIAITVPRGTQAISNGTLHGATPSKRKHGRHHRHGSRHKVINRVTWDYSSPQPMATYLATATVGDFTIDRRRVDGLGSLVAVDPMEARAARANQTLDQIGPIITLFDGLFGPYPFNQTGAIVDHAPTVGYALETQTRPIFDRAPDEITLLRARSLTSGSATRSASSARQDMWLNEGFATWAEWRWEQAQGGRTTAQQLVGLELQPATRHDLWDPPANAIPDASQLFATSVYTRGAMARRGAAPAGGRRDVLRHPAHLGRRARATWTRTRRSSSTSPRRSRASGSTTSSPSTCSSRASPRARAPRTPQAPARAAPRGCLTRARRSRGNTQTDEVQGIALPGALRRAGGGRIVNIGSMGGKLTFPGGGVYHATKYAVEALSDAMRFEVQGFGVRVVLIEPGLIRTEFANTAVASVEDASDPGDHEKSNRAVRTSTSGVYDGPLGRRRWPGDGGGCHPQGAHREATPGALQRDTVREAGAAPAPAQPRRGVGPRHAFPVPVPGA